MTPEEQQAKLEQLDKLKKLKQLQELRAQKAAMQGQAAPEPKMSGTDTARGALQAYNRGSMFGFGDEIVGAGRVLAEKLFPGPGSKYLETPDIDPNPGNDYAMYRDDERANMERFNEANPVASTALTIAGGVTSPLNRVAPGFGVGRGSGTVAGISRAGAEGAVVGLGEGEGSAEDQLKSAAIGAGTGAGVNSLFRAGSGVLRNTLLRRNVQPDLIQPDGSFKPIHLADPESTIADIQRGGLGRVWGAKKILQDQEEPFVRKAAQTFQDAKEAADIASDRIGMDYAERVANTADATATGGSRIKTGVEMGLAKTSGRAAQKAAKTALDFQAKAARESLPAHAQDALDGVNINSATETADAIRNWWNKNGFREVKENAFDIDPQLWKKIQDRVNSDPELRLAFGDELMPKLTGMVERLKGAAPAGQDLVPENVIDLLSSRKLLINGDALMAMRNLFASGANGTSRNSGPLRQIANQFDDLIRKQLPNEAVEQFDDQIQRYTTGLSFSAAARSKPVGLTDVIDPANWRTAAQRYGGKGMSTKKAPLAEAAAEGQNAINATKEAAKATEQKIRRASAKATTNLQNKSRLKNTVARKQRMMETKALRDDAKLPGGGLHDAQEAVKELQRNTVPGTSSGLSQLLSTGVLGSTLPGMAGRTKAHRVAAGAMLGKALVGKGSQMAIAGQTQIQQKANAALLRGDLDEYYRLISRLTAQGVTANTQ